MTTEIRMIGVRDPVGRLEPGGVLAIGNFDGVHLGHQEMLKTARDLASRLRTNLIVLTFEPHPAAVLRPEKAPAILTPLAWKLHLLEQFGPASILVVEGNKDLLELTAEQFVGQFLVGGIRPSVIVEGEDFGFGAGRGGSVDMLERLGAAHGFRVKVVPSQVVRLSEGRTIRVSSTAIRAMLSSGQAADASTALSRPYRLLGEIASGRGKGRQIGIPTLNMRVPRQLVPAEGVYAGWAVIADSSSALFLEQGRLPAAISIGRAPTFDDNQALLIEAHVLSGPVDGRPGRWMALDLVAELRRQQRFSDVKELVLQIGVDCDRARAILGQTR